MTTSNPTRQGLLRRLLRNRAGNVIVLTGAAMVPMAALAGSAVDMSRLYLVRARLQQACDAGALAGRRFMTETTFDANARAQANTYFNFNFPDGAYGVTSRSFTPSRTANGQVAGVASATVPMVVMHMFGMEPKTLGVECEAKFEVANTDIVFVLDTTGSMACDQADDTATCNANFGSKHPTIEVNGRYQARQAANSRLKALRVAIKGFYDTLDGATSSDARLRFGFVNYSSSVNVGREIMDIDPSYISDTSVFQSRRRNLTGFDENRVEGAWATIENPSYGNPSELERPFISQSACNDNLGSPNPAVSDQGTPYQFGDPRPSQNGNTQVTTTTQRRPARETLKAVTWGTRGQTGTSRTCIVTARQRSVTQERTIRDERTPRYNWRYEPIAFDTSRFKRGDAVSQPVGAVSSIYDAQGSDVTATWTGCIQERDTVANARVNVGDSNAFDLDIDLAPYDERTRWRTSWPQIVFNRTLLNRNYDPRNTDVDYASPESKNASFACPKAAQRLMEMERHDIDAYVDANDFVPLGATYHDIGLLWGARMISTGSIFSRYHGAMPNGGTVQRHVIFMTDGDMNPNATNYGTYGSEMMDRRIGSINGTEQTARHNYRFESICQAIKDDNVTLWVVAYGQDLTSQLTRCANPGLAFAATNAAQLQSQFRQIAAQIAELRLER